MDIEFNTEITRRILDLNEKFLEANLKLFTYLSTPMIEVQPNIHEKAIYPGKAVLKDE